MINLTDRFIRDDAARLLRGALAAQGLRALDNPLSAAVAHEAGHAVTYTAFGYEVRAVKVWRKRRGEARGQWVGFTTVDSILRTGPHTTPEADAIYASIIIAGVLAEQMFDHANFRAGSSLDEIATARGLASNIALKTGAEFASVMMRILSATGTILRDHDDVVRGIAANLGRHGVLGRSRLAPFLRTVSRLAPTLEGAA